MTPWQFKICCEANQIKHEGEHDARAWIMYHGAWLTKSMGKMPKLEQFLAKRKKRVKGIDEAAIIAGFKAYKRAFENGNSSKT